MVCRMACRVVLVCQIICGMVCWMVCWMVCQMVCRMVYTSTRRTNVHPPPNFRGGRVPTMFLFLIFAFFH